MKLIKMTVNDSDNDVDNKNDNKPGYPGPGCVLPRQHLLAPRLPDD